MIKKGNVATVTVMPERPNPESHRLSQHREQQETQDDAGPFMPCKLDLDE